MSEFVYCTQNVRVHLIKIKTVIPAIIQLPIILGQGRTRLQRTVSSCPSFQDCLGSMSRFFCDWSLHLEWSPSSTM